LYIYRPYMCSGWGAMGNVISRFHGHKYQFVQSGQKKYLWKKEAMKIKRNGIWFMRQGRGSTIGSGRGQRTAKNSWKLNSTSIATDTAFGHLYCFFFWTSLLASTGLQIKCTKFRNWALYVFLIYFPCDAPWAVSCAFD